jgi:hypothetical protein
MDENSSNNSGLSPIIDAVGSWVFSKGMPIVLVMLPVFYEGSYICSRLLQHIELTSIDESRALFAVVISIGMFAALPRLKKIIRQRVSDTHSPK